MLYVPKQDAVLQFFVVISFLSNQKRIREFADTIGAVHSANIKFGDLATTQIDKHLVWQIGQALP